MGTFNPKSRKSELYTSLGLYNTEPSSTENASEPPHILTLLATVLEKTICANDKFVKRSRTKDGGTIFHGSRAPTLSIRQYIERIFKYSKCSPSCFVVAYVYMDRFLEATHGYLTSFNAHRLLITSVLVASKFLDDLCFSNAYYGKIGGVSTVEINRMELKLLFSLDFKLQVTVGSFQEYCVLLAKEGATNNIRNSKADGRKQRATHACGLTPSC